MVQFQKYKQRQGFEGVLEIDYRDQSSRKSVQTEWKFKGDKMAIRLPSEQGDQLIWNTYLPNFELNKLIIITEQPYEGADGFFYEFPIDKIESAFPEEYNISKATGATKKFEGLDLVEYLISSTQSNSEIWYTTSLNIRTDLLKQFFKGSRAIQAIPEKPEGMFPLISRTRDSSGEIIEEIRITAVNRRPVHDAEFEIPDGFVSILELAEED